MNDVGHGARDGRTFGAWMAVAALVALAGCSWTGDLEALRAAPPADDAFSRALAAEYLAIAGYEADEMYDWIDSRHFARKGRRAAAGEIVAPEDPGDWTLPRAARAGLADGRERLVAAFASGARERAPVQAARAQAMYDCWLEQQEENWQTAHIAACRDGFEAALAALTAADPASGPGKGLGTGAETGRPVARALPAARRAQAAPRRFQIFFAFDRADLDPSARAPLAALAAEARRGRGPVRLVGHADRAGAAAYNLGLSRRRAEAVRAALLGAGIEADRVHVRALGEDRPLVATPDGVREPRNRRVEAVVEPRPTAANHVGSAPVGGGERRPRPSGHRNARD